MFLGKSSEVRIGNDYVDSNRIAEKYRPNACLALQIFKGPLSEKLLTNRVITTVKLLSNEKSFLFLVSFHISLFFSSAGVSDHLSLRLADVSDQITFQISLCFISSMFQIS